jgi:RimJ/RimL family protein N-acetyltransferase
VTDSQDHDVVRIPRLRTARLLLRAPVRADFDAFFADASHPTARQHIGGPLDRREAWRRFLSMGGNWTLLPGLGWWSVEEASAGWVGAVGVFQRETGPEIEIGWAMHHAHWGKGYATESARAALAYAHGPVGAARVIAYVGKSNGASIAVATKIGMRRADEVDFYGDPHWLYEATREAAA